MSPRGGRVSKLSYAIEIPPEVADHVRQLPPEIKRHVKQTLGLLAESPEGGKSLTGELSGLRSYRARRFRIVYMLVESERRLLILHIGHRRTVYEELTRKIANPPEPSRSSARGSEASSP